jgi:hypothetical protein
VYRAIWLIKRKAGLSHQQFREYYEAHHRPLGEKAMNGYAFSYDRHYLYSTTEGIEPVYDAVMQACFPNRKAYEQCTGRVQNDPETAKIFAEDDLNFLDTSACMHFEAQDSFSKLQPLPPSDTMFRTVWFARHKPGMTHEQCRAYYENKHRLIGEYIVNGYAYNYDRHYLYKITPGAPEPYYTFVMEMNFPSADSFAQISANIANDPTLARFIAEDEARYIDRDSAVHYRAEVSVSDLQPIALDNAA